MKTKFFSPVLALALLFCIQAKAQLATPWILSGNAPGTTGYLGIAAGATNDALRIVSRSNDILFQTGATPATRMWIKPDGKVGVGVSSPGTAYLMDMAGGLNLNNGIAADKALWVNGAEALFYNSTSKYFSWGYGADFNFFHDGMTIGFNSVTPPAPPTKGLIVEGHVGIGMSNPDPSFALDVAGTIRACEVKVNLGGGWCDYVFDKDYKLMPLSEVSDFIAAHHHLPNIPPAREVDAQGLDMGDMQLRMMEKIEEMTLYILQLKKENDELGKRIAGLETANNGTK